jgi:hypothetical protein
MIPSTRFSDQRAIGLVLGILVVLVTLLVLFQGFFFLPKIIMVVLILLAAALLGKIKPLVRDWFVFLAFFYFFDSIRGTIYILTCKFQLPVYSLYVLDLEKALFRGVPSVALQNALLRPNFPDAIGWLEKISTVIYGSHFIVFLFVGLIIWIYKAKDFPLYKTSFYLLSGTGLLLYSLVPTVPPWMAANHFGLMPPLNHFNIELYNLVLPDISNGFDTNPIAAMPSLHAGFPILCSLLLWRLYRWKGAPFYLYTLSVLFAIVYSGDHYMMDFLAGLGLAVGCYVLAGRILKRRALSPRASAEPVTAKSFREAAMKKRLLLGLGVFFVGVIIGGLNKAELTLRASSYTLDGPRYVDFFKNEDRYRDNYFVQAYFGNHFLARHELRTALRHFERSAELTQNAITSKDAQMKIALCRQALRLNN